jgi:hypothetical protein
MSGRRPSIPERLCASDATDLERRLLEWAARDKPSPELSQRMARAIGISAAPIAGGIAKPSAVRTRPPWHWISVGVATAAVSGVVAAIGAVGGFGSAVAPSRAVTPLGQSFQVVDAGSSEAPAPSVAVQPLPRIPSAPVLTRVSTERPLDDIADQIALLDAARAALAAGSAERALVNLEQYQRRYPAGSFRPEATALRIEGLVKLGRTGEARALADRFLADHRGGPLADRVAREVGVAPP